ncbi:hypothetical protein F4680DRAFT_341444 [Xylaria scruposa]|nr:hypothetical protein F4680DRAFT_341444 [Xylaria scruposa]
MPGHRGERMKSNTSRARDSVSDRTLVSHRQRPASPENPCLVTPRSRLARGTDRRHESAHGHAEAERSTSALKSRSRSLSSTSASTVEIADGRHSPSQSHQSPSTRKTKKKQICHRLKNTAGGCKFGDSCRYSHDMPPSAPREEPKEEPEEVPRKVPPEVSREVSREVPQNEIPEASLAYYPSWGANGMQGVPIFMMPTFFPQGSSSTHPQPRRLPGVAPSMNTDHLLTPRDQNRRVQEAASSTDLKQSPHPSGLSKIGANEKGKNSAPSLRQQQQQRREKSRDRPEKHARRATDTVGRDSDQQERHRHSRGEARASPNVRDDTTAHKRSVSRSSSEDIYSASSFDEDQHDKRSRAREAVRGKRTSHSPDALEERITKAAAAEVDKWRRELERAAKLEAQEDKTDEGRAASPPDSPPSTTKIVRSPNQPSKSHARDKNPGSKGEGSRGQSHMPKGKQNQRSEQRFSNRGQQPRRGFGQQRKQFSSSSSSSQQPRGRGGARATPTPAGVQRHVSHSPDAFEEEIATAAAAEEKNWARAQAQTAKGKAKPTRIVNRARQTLGPPSRGSQSTTLSGRAKTKGEESPNLIDI